MTLIDGFERPAMAASRVVSSLACARTADVTVSDIAQSMV